MLFRAMDDMYYKSVDKEDGAQHSQRYHACLSCTYIGFSPHSVQFKKTAVHGPISTFEWVAGVPGSLWGQKTDSFYACTRGLGNEGLTPNAAPNSGRF